MFEKVSETQFKEVKEIEQVYNMDTLLQRRDSIVRMIEFQQVELIELDKLISEGEKIIEGGKGK